MRRRQFLSVSAATVAGGAAGGPWASRLALGAGAAAAEDPLAGPAQGPWRRLFLDGAVVERSAGLERVFHAADKPVGQPVLQRDRPWEGISAIIGPYCYGTVVRDGGRLRMWYQFLNKGNHVGYAESDDGVAWRKPNLGLITFDGSRDNNIVVSAFDPEATQGGSCHNPSVVVRPEAANPEERYLLFGFDGAAGHARVAFSSDGLRWKYPPESARTPLFRSSDVVCVSFDPYQDQYYATWKTRNRRGRAVGVAWSPDGRQWRKPWEGPVFAADDLDPSTTQIYGMPVFPYQGMFIGLPWIYHARYFRFGEYNVQRMYDAQEDSPRTMDAQVAWSWDLINWTRPPQRVPLIPRGAEGTWDSGMVVTARAPIVMEDKLHFYYGGCLGVHDEPRVRAGIGLATLRLDGFCSLRAGDEPGWLITRREPAREAAVTINARTDAEGSVTAEIVDQRDRVVPGFSREQCRPFRGDSVSHVLRWESDRLPEPIRQADYKVKFWLRKADLYSYLPHGLDPALPDLARFPGSGP